MQASCLLPILLLCRLHGAGALNNGFRVPALGWSTWNHFGSAINHSIIVDTIDALVASGLSSAGYEYVNIDDGWASHRDADGRIVADPKSFPGGIKPLADHAHAKGVKLGLYTSRGNTTCLGRPGSAGYEAIDAVTYASWGIDYLKVDSCGHFPPGFIPSDAWARMRDALNGTGRSVWLTVCPDCRKDLGNGWGPAEVFSDCGYDAGALRNSWYSERCNMVNVFGLNNSGKCSNGNPRVPAGVLSQVDAQYTLENMTLGGAGGWPDMDIMFVCYDESQGMSWTEQVTHFALWAVMSSPLILSHDLRRTDSRCLDLVANTEVLAINQDPLALPAFPVFSTRSRLSSLHEAEVLAKRITGGWAIVMVNRQHSSAQLQISWHALPGLLPNATVRVREVLTKSNRGHFQGSYTTKVLPPHGAELITVEPAMSGMMDGND